MSIGGVPIATVMKISPVFDILLICMVIMIWITFERFRTYKRKSLAIGPFMEQIKYLISKNKYDQAVEFSTSENKPLANMVKAGLTNKNKGPDEVAELMEASRMDERIELEKWLPVLGTLGNASPFIGLLGTVIGIIRAFKLLESAGGEGATAIMVGIAEALVTTAMGLIVAIPAVMIFNYFMGKVKNWYIEMEVVSKELIAEMVPGGERAKPVSRAKTGHED